ncbi:MULTISPECIES: hypothetical protein [unclassified Leptolyngbya]|nr:MULTISPECIES: hypothetical protein [unclassified Leptolyngbya]
MPTSQELQATTRLRIFQNLGRSLTVYFSAIHPYWNNLSSG